VEKAASAAIHSPDCRTRLIQAAQPRPASAPRADRPAAARCVHQLAREDAASRRAAPVTSGKRASPEDVRGTLHSSIALAGSRSSRSMSGGRPGARRRARWSRPTRQVSTGPGVDEAFGKDAAALETASPGAIRVAAGLRPLDDVDRAGSWVLLNFPDTLMQLCRISRQCRATGRTACDRLAIDDQTISNSCRREPSTRCRRDTTPRFRHVQGTKPFFARYCAGQNVCDVCRRRFFFPSLPLVISRMSRHM